MSDQLIDLVRGMGTGQIVPVLGPGALAGVVDKASGSPIPADSDSLILGLNDGKPMSAGLGGTDYRFRLDHYDGSVYREVDQESVDHNLPVLFKPMGSPRPDATYIASDADDVDYITELMGGFAIPNFLKSYRQGRQYALLGLRLLRDTERMVMSDIIYAAGSPPG